jgi:thiazole synthase
MYSNPIFCCNGLEMTRVWHCFGNHMHQVNLQTILNMLSASKTNVLPINTNSLSHTNGRDGLIIGFGSVHFDQFALAYDVNQLIIMLNINHQTTMQAAVDKTLLATGLTGESVIKLEVLNDDLITSNNSQLIKAVEQLNKHNNNLIIMPLLSCNLDDAKRLIDLGCPLLRVMGSSIGSGSGILDIHQFEQICKLGMPIVLDGGVASADDFILATKLGAQGCLVNSMLFGKPTLPEENLKKFMIASQTALEKFEDVSLAV